MKVLLDTNVIVSAVTTRGLCADVFRTVLADHDLVTCPQVLQEVQTILSTKFSVPKHLVAEYLELLRQDAVVTQAKDHPLIPIKDKDDEKIIAAAIVGGVQILVTGDREVQNIKRIGKLKILSPRAFWELLGAQPSGKPDPGKPRR